MACLRSAGSVRGPRRGFTLVELLVVVTIIGILIALLLPAVQAAREAARRLQCANNLKQLALGCLQHEEKHGFLPTGGWGWGYAGDPDRGFSKRQPGGWHFNVLPFIDLGDLHDLGLNGNRDGGRQMAETPVTAFQCPTRRKAIAYPFTHGSNFVNIDRPRAIGRSDYAANAGDGCVDTYYYGPGSYGEGDGYSEAQWQTQCGTSHEATGVIFRRSECKMASITDGESYTYLLGERYLSPDNYEDGTSCDNDQGWVLAYDYDVNRWTSYPPVQDRAGYGTGGCNVVFGSSHAGSFAMALCDGSVRWIRYSIDPENHRRLGNRKDGQSIDESKF